MLLYGLAGGALIALLKVVDYLHFVRTYPGEAYGAIIAALFAALGLWLGARWHRPRTDIRPESRAGAMTPSGPVGSVEPGSGDPRAVGLTPREHEILLLIAEGLSNREIGERLFVSENTVKTHSSRLFDKMNVRRRVQAVKRARELGLIA